MDLIIFQYMFIFGHRIVSRQTHESITFPHSTLVVLNRPRTRERMDDERSSFVVALIENRAKEVCFCISSQVDRKIFPTFSYFAFNLFVILEQQQWVISEFLNGTFYEEMIRQFYGWIILLHLLKLDSTGRAWWIYMYRFFLCTSF